MQKEILERVPQAVNIILLGVGDHGSWISQQKMQLQRNSKLANLNMMANQIEKKLRLKTEESLLTSAIDVSKDWAEEVRQKEMKNV